MDGMFGIEPRLKALEERATSLERQVSALALHKVKSECLANQDETMPNLAPDAVIFEDQTLHAWWTALVRRARRRAPDRGSTPNPL
jgi:hypothetical protein